MYEPNLIVTAGFDFKLSRVGFRDLSPRDDFISAARNFALDIYNRRLRETGKDILVDKTPRYCHILPFIHELFPKAKKIWLKRNLLDVAASFRNTWNAGLDEMVGERITRHTFDLILSTANLCDFFGAHSGFQVQYEDLARQPQTLIADLCEYLNVTQEGGLTNYSLESASLDTMKNKKMGDKSLFLHNAPHSRSIDAWKKAFSQREVQRLANAFGEPLLDRAGYPDLVAELRAQGIKFPSIEESNLRVAAHRKLFASNQWTFWDEEPLAPTKSTKNPLRGSWWRNRSAPANS